MTPLERFEFYKKRIETLNPELNVYIHLCLEQAEEDARASEQRVRNGRVLSDIDGWCVAVKANIAVKGLPHHAGIAAYKDDIAIEDAVAVARLRKAGAVVLGVVNMHEGALGATTDNETFGRTHNPWKHGFTPGGSSGGSGCVVAAGLSDFALGSDTMGSVRIPSAYCGVQGHKPTTGLVPDKGVLALSYTLDHVGPHARSVDELLPILRVLGASSLDQTKVELRSIKIGIWSGEGDVVLTPSVQKGFEELQSKLSASAISLKKVSPPVYDYGKSRRAGLLVSEVEAAKIHEEKLKTNPDGFSDLFKKLMAWGAARPQEDIDKAYEHIFAVKDASMAAFNDVDVVIAPTAPQQAFSFEDDVPANQADFTAWANFAALPATAVCIGLSEDKLPLSCQIIGKENEDAFVLAVAQQIEELCGRPPSPYK